MPALHTITIKGFKSIADVEKLELRSINVVIGPNGSGKSNFIGAFSFLHAIREGRLQAYVADAGGADKVLHFGSKTTQEIYIDLQFWQTNRYEITLRPNANDELVPFREVAWFFGDRIGRWTDRVLQRKGNEAGISGSDLTEPIARHVRDDLSRWRVYHFHDTSTSSPMKRTGDLNDNRLFRSDGSNLAAYLYFLKSKHPESYGLIKGTVRLVAPFFDDFVLEPMRLNSEKIRLEWRHVGSDAYYDASSMSDGSIRFIALATLLLQPFHLRPSVILIDEPELGLHPYAITMLASLIKQAAVQTQVIVSTQSALLLDNFDPEDVLVANRAEGSTTFKRLSSAPLAEYLTEYSLGQLWEKNEIGGRPGGR